MLSPRIFRLALGAIAFLFLLVVVAQVRYTVMLLELLARGQSIPATFVQYDPDTKKVGFVSDEFGKAGAKVGDKLLSVDGYTFASGTAFERYVLSHRPGATLAIQLQRGQDAPFVVQYRLLPYQAGPRKIEEIASIVLIGLLTPWFCLTLGLFVAARRPRDPAALSLLFVLWGLSQIVHTNTSYMGIAHPFFTYLMALLSPIATVQLLAAWLWFSLNFPDRSSSYRLLPAGRWLFGLPLVILAVLNGIANLAAQHEQWRMRRLEHILGALPGWVFLLLSLGAGLLGLVNLFYKRLYDPQPATRRKLRLLLAGVGVGSFPLGIDLIVLWAFNLDASTKLNQQILTAAAFLLLIIPATMAYVVVVQRAMDVGIVVRQGLQYALASRMVMLVRGILLALFGWMAFHFSTDQRTGWREELLVGACIAAFFLVRRGGEWLRVHIDRRFFREAVNSERVLHDLSEQVHGIVEPAILLRTLSDRIAEALHVPRVIALLPDGGHYRPAYAHGFSGPPPAVQLPSTSPLLHRLKDGSRPLLLEPADRDGLASLDTEVLLPLTAKGELSALLSLGPKRSEQPYSPADLRLLQLVGSQAGLALENSRLVATVAAEAAQRESIQRELDIARDVQQRLFPKAPPAVPGLQLAGACRPAQSIGGDYYDFLVTSAGEVGFAIGDVSGKGVPAALLMACLQASLRGLTLAGIADLGDLMTKLNRLIYDATPASRFATFFYGLYEPATGRLRYSSAGHNPALLIRASGESVLRLTTRGVGLGLTRHARYQEADVYLAPGDQLVLYTDGITEAMNENHEEFGDEQLLACVTSNHRPPAELQAHLFQAVTAFSGTAPQHDDMTVIVVERVAGT